jgi:uncharacterized protein YgiM (DUF1202 family)
MKKIAVVLTAVVFLFSTATVSFAGGYRHYPRFHGYHGYHSHHGLHGDYFWWGLGFGVLTGALVSGMFYAPPPPPVYYAPAAVVVPPRPVVTDGPRYRTYATSRTTDQIRVGVSLLNVRGGPGLNEPVVATVPGGASLQIMGNAPDWLYVRTPSGIQGWVMSRFTLPDYPRG